MRKIYDGLMLGFRVPAGVRGHIEDASDALGVKVGEFLSATFRLEADDQGQQHLVAKVPNSDSVAVVGRSAGRIIGSLGDLMRGTVQLDGPEAAAEDFGRLAQLPWVASWEDCERINGRWTGRLARRRIKRPGRNRRVQAERARAVADITLGAGDA